MSFTIDGDCQGQVAWSVLRDVIPLMFLDHCPFQVGDLVTGPLSDSRRSSIGFPGVGKIIDVQKEEPLPGIPFQSTRYHVKLEVTLPDRA